MTRPFLLISAGVLLLAFARGQQKTEPAKSPPQVLFVCEHGAAKSVIAAAYFNKMAEERGLSQRAVSRGTKPDSTYSPAVIKGLQQDGVAVEKGKPVLVTDADVAKAARVVTLGCELPPTARATKKAEDWNDIPSVIDNYRAAQRAIANRVEQLINELAAEKAP